jgi:hypothetical protein
MNEIKLPTATNVMNQQKIVIQSFGLAYIKTAIYKGNIPKPDHPVGEYGRDKSLYLSKLGNPVFSDFNVQSGKYTKNGQSYSFDEIKFDTVLFDVSMAKNIVKTPIQGRDGTIKEYISDDDYAINIKGVMTAPNNTFPLDDFVSLIKVVKSPVALKINSWYLEKFGIYNVVVTGFSFSQRAGRFSEQMFEISAISDTPVELNITK